MSFFLTRRPPNREIDAALLNLRGVNVNCLDHSRNSPLHLAVKYCADALSIVCELLNAGANPTALNHEGFTPLHMVIMSNEVDIQVMDELIKGGANVNVRDRMGNSPLQTAVKCNRLSIIEKLINCGADINCKDPIGETPLHYCIRSGNVHAMTKLLQYKNTLDVNLLNDFRETPLMCAVTDGNLEAIKKLLVFGASASIPNKYNVAPLHVALQESNIELIADLVKYNADIYCLDSVLQSPLKCAIQKYCKDPSEGLRSAKILLKCDVLRNSDESEWCMKRCLNEGGEIVSHLCSFVQACVAEVRRMKSEMIQGNYCFFEFVTRGLENGLFSVRTPYKELTIDQILDISRKYPIYGDIIAIRLEKMNLRKKVMNLGVYTTKEGGHGEQQKIILDCYSIFAISAYLSNVDMFNIILVFPDLKGKSETNLEFKHHALGKSIKRKIR